MLGMECKFAINNFANPMFNPMCAVSRTRACCTTPTQTPPGPSWRPWSSRPSESVSDNDDDDADDDMFQHADGLLQSDRRLPGQPPIPADRPRHIVWVDTDILII